MKFLEEEKDMFIICSNEDKSLLIDYISHKDKMYSVHFFTMSELKKKLLFDYTKEAIYETSKFLRVKPEVAKVYIDNLYYIEDKLYNNLKLDQLVELKKRLDDLNLLIYDDFFLDYIKDKKIIAYNLNYLSKFDKSLLTKLGEVSYISDDANTYKPKVYHLDSLEDEVEFVANKILDLIVDGIDINKIKLVGVDADYENSLKRIFDYYNIPTNFNTGVSILATNISKYFLDNFDNDISKTIDKLKNKYTGVIVNKIIEICNSYSFVDDKYKVKDFIISDLKNTKVISEKIDKAVEVIPLSKASKDDYIFLLNFNLNSIPKYKKDEDFISDNIKKLVDLDTTEEENKLILERTKNKILSIKNLVITYKDKSNTKSYYPSNLINTLKLDVEEGVYDYKYSNTAIKIKLAKKIDNYIKFGTKDKDIDLLGNSISINYNNYDNRFSGIDKEMFYNYINHELCLSYSTLDNYNKCAFRYYLTNVLKLDIYEDNFITFVGSLFHYVLEKCLMSDTSVDEEVSNYLNNNERVLTVKEKFLLKKLIKELYFIIDTIKEQMNHSVLSNVLCENKIEIDKSRDIKVTFKGFIDKICYKKVGDRCVVAIIDYKTGNTPIDIINSSYGIGIQLPIYLYLSKNYKKLENVVFAGFYLQTILNDEVLKDDKKSLEEVKKDNLKLRGYSNSDVDILKMLDDDYVNSSVISGMGLYKNGNFKTKKVLTNDQIDKLISVTENVVDKTIDNILDVDFSINPKQIGDSAKDIIGCKYCKFKDICYVSNKDYVKLEKKEDLSFLDE